MARRRRRQRRYRSSGPSPSSVVVDLLDVQFQSLSSNSTTRVFEVTTDVNNTTGETQNRKIVSISGEHELIARIGPSKYIALISGFLVWPKERELPTVAEWDPFTPKQPGDAAYEGQPSFFGRREYIHALPAQSSNSIVGESRFIRSRPGRLLKPGYELRWVCYAKGEGTISNCLNIGVRVEG